VAVVFVLTDADLAFLLRSTPDAATRFFSRFSDVAVAAAKQTGMLVGWTTLEHSGGQELLYRCLLCGVGHVYWLGADDVEAEHKRVERLMDLQFDDAAARRNCPHWEAYKELRGA
jgi:hypothetical protein